MDSYLGKTEAMDLGANAEETDSEVEHEEVPKKEATVETSGALKKGHGDWYLGVRSHGQPKKQT
jgi:hypothetical protein